MPPKRTSRESNASKTDRRANRSIHAGAGHQARATKHPAGKARPNTRPASAAPSIAYIPTAQGRRHAAYNDSMTRDQAALLRATIGNELSATNQRLQDLVKRLASEDAERCADQPVSQAPPPAADMQGIPPKG